MRIAVGSDHAGLRLKSVIVEFLKRKGHEVRDLGTHSEESTHYPIFAKEVCLALQNSEVDRGVLICGTGIGMCITANKFEGIRAALCLNEYMARMSRLHNDSNVLCLGDRVVGQELALSILDVWLNTPFEGGRHEVRVKLIRDIEKEACQPDG